MDYRKRRRERHKSARRLRLEPLEDRRMLATLTVTNVSDSGEGSLRQALFDANTLPGVDVIQFAIPSTVKTIRPLTQLPWITEPVVIDGTSQAGYHGQPIIEISGELLTGNLSGFTLQSSASTIRGLAINRFPISGIDIRGQGLNTIDGNYIGTDITGMVPLPNGRFGIHIDSPRNIIGGALPQLRNVISGNGEDGVRIWGASATENTVMGNWIGTTAQGNAPLANGRDGVLIGGNASNNIVGTNGDAQNDISEGNIISGNMQNGVRIFQANSNSVSGNIIGLSADGQTPVANKLSGVLIDAEAIGNSVGVHGDLPGDAQRNIISGNDQNGVFIFKSHQNIVAGNWIGLAPDGTQAMGNGERGILVAGGSTQNLIGTNDDGQADALERNVVSGNVHQGIYLNGLGTIDNIVAGNYVGTDVSGTQAVPNTSTGVLLANTASNNVIGVSNASPVNSNAGNLISGNTVFGVRLRGDGTSQNLVAGNWIGLNAAGDAALANGTGGISSFQGATGNQIGGTRARDANTISGNMSNGIIVQADSGNQNIIGNRIGTAADGTTPLGNELSGIYIESSNDNIIGNGLISGSNTIAFNGTTGIAVMGTAIRNAIANNSIFGNGSLGIDLGDDGMSANDPQDEDSGPNHLQNFPEIQVAAANDTSTHLAGVLESIANAAFQIEFFASDDQSGRRDGREFIGSAMVTTDAQGIAAWSVEYPLGLAGSQVITATARSSAGSTSEFSSPKPVSELLTLEIDQSQLAEGQTAVMTIGRGSIPIASEVTVTLSSNTSQLSLPGSAVIPAGRATVDVTIQALDDIFAERAQTMLIQATSTEAAGAVLVTIAPSDLGWHNLDSPLDVSGNGLISAEDVLQVINAVNSGLNNIIGLTPLQPRSFVDVNNDGIVSASDALMIINDLNNAVGSPEGEARDELSAAHDFVFAVPSIDIHDAAFDWLASDVCKRRRHVP